MTSLNRAAEVMAGFDHAALRVVHQDDEHPRRKPATPATQEVFI